MFLSFTGFIIPSRGFLNSIFLAFTIPHICSISKPAFKHPSRYESAFQIGKPQSKTLLYEYKNPSRISSSILLSTIPARIAEITVEE